MKNQNTKTVTQFIAFVKKPDGSWKAFPSPTSPTREEAEEKMDQHNQLAKVYPKDFTHHPEYKIMKRTVVTSFGEWEDA